MKLIDLENALHAQFQKADEREWLGKYFGGRPLAVERANRIRTEYAPAHLATGGSPWPQ